jgi:Ca2+-binding RTX toxin-like protein
LQADQVVQQRRKSFNPGKRKGMALAWIFAGLTSLVAIALVSGASAASPCAGGPTTSADGTRVYGSECADRIVVRSQKVREVVAGGGDDTIYVNPDVEVVQGGEGDDFIYGELPETERGEVAAGPAAPTYPRLRPSEGQAGQAGATASIACNGVCYGGDGSQELVGGSGNDTIFGQRGNDILKGNAGNDALYGGVGDEPQIAGGSGADLLSGGLGTDHLDGEEGSDLIRGDGTMDELKDTGSTGTDTLSFATGVAPGFGGAISVAGFPAEGTGEERGVMVRLDGGELPCGSFEGNPLEACNSEARYGGGADQVAVSGFENVIGSPFADVIYGSNANNTIYGGGGSDVLYGQGGNDVLYGGADGDLLKGGAGEDVAWGEGSSTANNCIEVETPHECGSAEAVTQRDRSKISVGFMTREPGGLQWSELYLTGSNSADLVSAGYYVAPGGIGHVLFQRSESSAAWDKSADAETAGCLYEITYVDCTLASPTDALVLAGMGGNDEITLNIGEQFWQTTSPILLGGEGNDVITGNGYTEDLLVDGPGGGEDTLKGMGDDDGLMNNEGKDRLEGGYGNDLLVSAVNCEGDTLQGASAAESDGAGINNASWAKYVAGGILADLESRRAGSGWSGSTVVCASGEVSTLGNIDDLEGTNFGDELYGDSHDNNFDAHKGADKVFGREGNDRIEVAGDGAGDSGGGGPNTAAGDTCVIDPGDTFSGCEH